MSERNPTALHDDDLMSFGKCKGQRLGDVPDSEYANNCFEE